MSVVLGYDESPGAERALRVALEVATAFGEPLVLVYGAAAPGAAERGVPRPPRGRPPGRPHRPRAGRRGR